MACLNKLLGFGELRHEGITEGIVVVCGFVRL